MKYKIGDKFKNKISGLVIEVIDYEDGEYVVIWRGGFPNSLDDSHIDEYYDLIVSDQTT